MLCTIGNNTLSRAAEPPVVRAVFDNRSLEASYRLVRLYEAIASGCGELSQNAVLSDDFDWQSYVVLSISISTFSPSQLHPRDLSFSDFVTFMSYTFHFSCKEPSNHAQSIAHRQHTHHNVGRIATSMVLSPRIPKP